MDLRYFAFRQRSTCLTDTQARALWRRLPRQQQDLVRAQARKLRPVLAGMRDDSWLLMQQCVWLLRHELGPGTAIWREIQLTPPRPATSPAAA